MLFVCKHETRHETKQVAEFTETVDAASVMDAQIVKKNKKNLKKKPSSENQNREMWL